MKTCETCKMDFKYKQVLGSLSGFKKYGPLVCRECGEIYTVTFRNRLKISVAVAIPMIISMYLLNFFNSLFVIIWGLLTLLVLPFFIERKKD